MKTGRKIKSSPADKVFTVCNTIFMILFILVTLYPILNTLAIAFNDGTDALRGGNISVAKKMDIEKFHYSVRKRQPDYRRLYYCGTNFIRYGYCACNKCYSGIYCK